MIELIIFDWDDVFTLGSTNGYKKCYHEAAVGVGMHLSPAEEASRINAKWGASHYDELAELVKDQPELLDKAIVIYENSLFGNTFVDCLSIVPGSVDLLRKLTKNYKLALATGVHPKLLRERIMPKFGINPDWFQQIVTAYDLDDPSHAKPHPYSVRRILKTQNVAAENTILVGDASQDVLMAQKANVEPIVVLTGHLNLQEAKTFNVSHIIPNDSQLDKILHRM